MNEKRSLNALLIGRDHALAWTLPQLLSRAGFYVDVISSSPLMRNCKFARNCDIVPSTQSLLPAITRRIRSNYDWIVITDDGTLTEISKSNLSIENKLKLLPVQKEENFSHLFSKIGLSQVFFANGVNTPPFFVAENLNEALLRANQLGYPVLLKLDSSGGGGGVFECNAPSDFKALKVQFFDNPILVQKKISGIEIDLSALYLEQDLIHFSYARPEKVCLNKFGPSLLRTYYPLSRVDTQIFQELSHIGKVLGAHGFTNISCIESQGRRFYFEVDMRPNVWIETPRHFGEDPAIRIQKWFSTKEKLSYPVPLLPNQPSQILIPYFLRLKSFELLFNRYDVWKFIPRDDWKLITRLIIKRMFSSKLNHHIVVIAKRIIPQKYHNRIRQLKRQLNF
jgi:hypothetical protein